MYIYIWQSQQIIYKGQKMIDWQGLLKFSLKYSDGTKKSEFKEMTKQDKKFLEQALNHYCNSQIHRLQQILKQLNQLKFQEQEVNVQNLLEQMQQILDSLDKGAVLYKMNGHITLIRIIFYSKYSSNKIIALQILSSANQNDAGVQNQSINVGALELVELIKNQPDIKVKENMMSTISAILRGQNLQAKRIFIKINGLQLLKNLLQKNQSQRLKNKIMTLFRDLLYYDDHLHQTYHDLSPFSNTAGLKVENCIHHDLTYDVNAEKLKENYKPENEKYKDMIHKFMVENPQIKKQYDQWVKKEEENNN